MKRISREGARGQRRKGGRSAGILPAVLAAILAAAWISSWGQDALRTPGWRPALQLFFWEEGDGLLEAGAVREAAEGLDVVEAGGVGGADAEGLLVGSEVLEAAGARACRRRVQEALAAVCGDASGRGPSLDRSGAHPNAVLGTLLCIVGDFGIPSCFRSDLQASCRFEEGFLLRYHRGISKC
jgi:hypothetical protein